jgi:hypothetical protein
MGLSNIYEWVEGSKETQRIFIDDAPSGRPLTITYVMV